MENIVEDMGKIDFINESQLWSSDYIQNYLIKNEHITTHPYKFNSIYTFETAKKVYDYYKQFFLVLGYDPFSFTTEELSNEEKIRFLHEII
jgi:squalene cyclase